MRRIGGAAILAAAALLLPGCAVACPAIGWINTVTVDASAVDGVADLQFCIEDECSPRVDETPDPSEPVSLLSTSREGDDWVLHLDMNAPDTVLIRLYDVDGVLIDEGEHPVDWTHASGPCGAPSTAPPIVLDP